MMANVNAQMQALASSVRSLRLQRGLSTVELSRRAGVARATLAQIEATGGNPTLETLYALANALDAPLADLIATPPGAGAPRVVRSGEGPHVVGDAVEAWLLETVTSARRQHQGVFIGWRPRHGAVRRRPALDVLRRWETPDLRRSG
jgi:transcriptional regulator with XRE-family HTH domain